VSSSAGGHATVLVVDDEEGVANVLAHRLGDRYETRASSPP
jgi:DNA-binding NtrC family response regulator